MSLVALVLLGDVLVIGQVVGVPHPAVVVGVVLVAVREVGRHPAVDRLTDVLLRADDDGEHDEQGRREPVVETVGEVVVVAGCQVRHPAHLTENLVHLSRFSAT